MENQRNGPVSFKDLDEPHDSVRYRKATKIG